MDRTSLIVKNLRHLADVLENHPTLTGYGAIILGLQACVSLVVMQAYGEQKKMIENAAHDFSPSEFRNQGGNK